MPADQSIGLPPNTSSVITEHYVIVNGRRKVIAETHHYVQRVQNPSRTWLPDPKLIVDGEDVYRLDPEA